LSPAGTFIGGLRIFSWAFARFFSRYCRLWMSGSASIAGLSE
jgi:hypothetical protein